MPSRFSSARTWSETAGWVTPSRSAACEKLRRSTTAQNAASWRVSISTSYRLVAGARLDRHHELAARAVLPAAAAAARRGRARRRGDRARLRADARAARAERDPPPRRRPGARRRRRARQGAGDGGAAPRAPPLREGAPVRPRARARLARGDARRPGASGSRPRPHTTTSSRRRSTSSASEPRRGSSSRTPSRPTASHGSARSRRSSVSTRGSRRSTTSPTSSPTRQSSTGSIPRSARRRADAAGGVALPPPWQPALPRTCSTGSAATSTCTRSSSPAPREQRDEIRGLGLPSLHVPEHAIDAQSLVGLADLVVSAGGTMNREAVALGTPVYTTFAGRLGAVDEALIRDGRLVPLTDARTFSLGKRDPKAAAADPTGPAAAPRPPSARPTGPASAPDGVLDDPPLDDRGHRRVRGDVVDRDLSSRSSPGCARSCRWRRPCSRRRRVYMKSFVTNRTVSVGPIGRQRARRPVRRLPHAVDDRRRCRCSGTAPSGPRSAGSGPSPNAGSQTGEKPFSERRRQLGAGEREDRRRGCRTAGPRTPRPR